MVFSNVCVEITILSPSFVFSQSKVRVPAGITQLGGVPSMSLGLPVSFSLTLPSNY